MSAGAEREEMRWDDSVGDAAQGAALWRRLKTAASRAGRYQSAFSVVSALFSGVLAVVFLVDMTVQHPGFQRGAVLFWFSSYFLAAVVPLSLGRRYPKWAGLLVVSFVLGWTLYFIGYSGHLHAGINALLQLPTVALYLGWFYRGAVGRPFMLAILAVTVIGAWRNTVPQDAGISLFTTIGYSVMIAGFCFEGARVVQRQGEIAGIVDPLTGVLNRRGLENLGPKMLRAARRDGARCSLVVVDFDDFKGINDTLGHAAGDSALRESAQAWAVDAGENELVARSGGDEFVLILRASGEETERRMRRLRADSGHAWSWGIAEATDGTADENGGLGALMARADGQLYRAKEARGR